MKTLKFTICLFTLLNLAIYCQGITISSGATLTGSFAAITIPGNWSNSGTFTAGTGTVIFNGASGNQTITNSSGETFYNLTVNKAGGDVQLSNNITVNGTIALTSGDIDLNGKVITLGGSALLSETSGNTVKGTSGTITTTRTLNAPASINVAGMGAEITSTANLGSTTISRGVAVQTGNSNSSILRYFDIAPATNTGLNATLVFHYDESELNGVTESELELFHSTDGGSTWTEDGGTVNTIDNTVTLSGINSFSRWTLGSTSSPLPVELTSFDAETIEDKVILNWHTETEVKNYGFEVERSQMSDTGSQKTVWVDVGFLKGAGNSNSPKNYSFTDRPTGGTSFLYRIKQIDNDGKFSYSKIVDVNIQVPKRFELFQNYPNPFNPSTRIDFEIPKSQNVEIKIYDVLGREITTLLSEYKKAGKYSVEFNGKNLPSGIYFYRIKTDNYIASKKMILIK
jgi:Secretion system C-terminal sorting domain